jgi:hypothetical protein
VRSSLPIVLAASSGPNAVWAHTPVPPASGLVVGIPSTVLQVAPAPAPPDNDDGDGDGGDGSRSFQLLCSDSSTALPEQLSAPASHTIPGPTAHSGPACAAAAAAAGGMLSAVSYSGGSCNEVRCSNPAACTEDEYCATQGDRHEVQCCSDTDLGGWASCTVGGDIRYAERDAGGMACTSDATLAEAEAVCSGVGARLCTSEELDARCGSGTGCYFDGELVVNISSCRFFGIQPLLRIAE